MKKLFENIGGNQFKLLTESVDNGLDKAMLVREGLKKVFSSGDKSLSYKKLQGIGLGYIKSVEEAKKTAIQEARILAKEYGYMEDENAQKFVKEDETNMSDPAEAREVQIGKAILQALDNMNVASTSAGLADDIRKLAQELIQMHGQR